MCEGGRGAAKGRRVGWEVLERLALIIVCDLGLRTNPDLDDQV